MSISYYSLLPAGYVAALLMALVVPLQAIPQGSIGGQAFETLLLPIPFLAACAQYYFLGWMLDKLIQRKGKKRP